MAKIIEAPSRDYQLQKVNLFLAGGIMNCPDWQAEAIAQLSGYQDLNIFNPRRENFSTSDPNIFDEQVEWEFEMLGQANLILVWFARGSLNPIVLYELGMWVNSRQTAAKVGIDPEYPRPKDVYKQTQLARPDIEIVSSLDELIAQIKTQLSPK